MDKLCSVEEAAGLLGGISKWTIRAWLSQGRLKRTKVGSRTMVRESEGDDDSAGEERSHFSRSQ